MTDERKFVLGVDRIVRFTLAVIILACLFFAATGRASGIGGFPGDVGTIGDGTSIRPGFAPMQRGAAGSVVPSPWQGLPVVVSFEKGGYASGAVLSDAIWTDTVAGIKATQSTEAAKPVKTSDGNPLFSAATSYLRFPEISGSQTVVLRMRNTQGTGTTIRVFSVYTSGSDAYAAIYTGSKLEFYNNGYATLASGSNQSQSTIQNTWTTFVMTSSSSPILVTIKPDGGAISTGSYNAGNTSPNGMWRTSLIGATGLLGTIYPGFAGEMRLFQVYKPALTNDQTTQLLNLLEGY